MLGIPRDCVGVTTLLSGHEWGSERVLESMRRALRRTRSEHQELRQFWDIDVFSDLVQLIEEIERKGPPHPPPVHSLGLLESLS